VVESVVQPVLRPAPEVVPVVEMPPEDEPEVRVLGQSEDPERVAPNIALGATGVAAAFVGGLDAGQGPLTEAERVMVQHGGAPGFNRSEQEEEEVWKAQYEVCSQIQAALESAFQLHKTTDFEISSVSALPRDSSISDLICASSAYTLHPQRLRQISRDKSIKLAQQHSEV